MTHSEGIQYVTEQQAVEYLLARGYTRETCAACGGTGSFEKDVSEFFQGMARAKERRVCEKCEGHKWRWKEPEGR